MNAGMLFSSGGVRITRQAELERVLGKYETEGVRQSRCISCSDSLRVHLTNSSTNPLRYLRQLVEEHERHVRDI